MTCVNNTNGATIPLKRLSEDIGLTDHSDALLTRKHPSQPHQDEGMHWIFHNVISRLPGLANDPEVSIHIYIRLSIGSS